MSFTIRLARPGDEDSAISVIRPVYEEYGFTWDPDDYHADLYDLDKHYLSPGHQFWIAELADGTPVGTIALEFHSYMPGNPGEVVVWEGMPRVSATDAELNRLYVLPDARKMGVGSSLVDLLLRTARDRHVRAIEIWSDKRLHNSHRLYQRLGAVKVGDRICDDPDVSPEWGFRLAL